MSETIPNTYFFPVSMSHVSYLSIVFRLYVEQVEPTGTKSLLLQQLLRPGVHLRDSLVWILLVEE